MNDFLNKIIVEGEALALDFEKKAATRSNWFVRRWYRKRAQSIRKDLQHIYKDAT